MPCERKHIEAGRPYWCGFPLHLCVGMRCAFHLGTIVGGFAVSTVGAYFPSNSDKMDTVGSGANDFYEMAVAPCSGLDENMNPITGEWEIIERFADSRDAERAHHAKVAALAACDESPWRPIETAPKDGRAVLLHNNNAPGNPSGHMESCEGYNTVVGEWWASDESDRDADGFGDWICYMDAIEDPRCPFDPTHWMPLPAAPEVKP